MNRRAPSSASLRLAAPPMLSVGLLMLAQPERAALRALGAHVDGVANRLAAAMYAGGAAMHETLMGLHAEIAAATTEGANHPMAEITARHGIERRGFVAIVDGWNMYLARPRPRDDVQVVTFLRQAVVAPMDIALRVLGHDAPAELASALGHAVGRTRLLQHTATGLARGIVHFPESELERFGVEGTDLAEGRRTPKFHDLCWFAAERCRTHLAQASALIAEVPRSESRAFLRLVVAGHEAIVASVVESGYDLFSDTRHEPGRLDSARLALRARKDL